MSPTDSRRKEKINQQMSEIKGNFLNPVRSHSKSKGTTIKDILRKKNKESIANLD